MGRFVQSRPDAAVIDPATVPSLAEPSEGWVDSVAGPLLTFPAAAELLRSAGIAMAPFVVVEPDTDPDAALPFAGPYVVKLADVAHRTEIWLGAA